MKTYLIENTDHRTNPIDNIHKESTVKISIDVLSLSRKRGISIAVRMTNKVIDRITTKNCLFLNGMSL